MNTFRVLVVDDNPKIGIFLREILQDEGVDVGFVLNGEEAINTLKKKSYQVVFLDVLLPGMNGIQVLEKIRAFNQQVKVVLMTGYSLFGMIEKAKNYDIYDSLQKPVNIDIVTRIVRDIKNQ